MEGPRVTGTGTLDLYTVIFQIGGPSELFRETVLLVCLNPASYVQINVWNCDSSDVESLCLFLCITVECAYIILHLALLS